jgi:hypothetical protein
MAFSPFYEFWWFESPRDRHGQAVTRPGYLSAPNSDTSFDLGFGPHCFDPPCFDWPYDRHC